MMEAHGAFAQLFDESELDTLYADSSSALGRVPSWHAAFGPDPSVDYDMTRTDHLSNEAAQRVGQTTDGADWLRKLKPRLMPSALRSEIASAMAELRCYGALLEAGFEVAPVPTNPRKPTPDFEVQGPDGAIYVEVASKQEDGAQTIMSERMAAGETPDGAERGVMEGRGARIETTIREVHPFGAPNPEKPNDSTQANAISRLCSVKGKEHQAKGATSLLWIDLRELGPWPDVVDARQCEPIIVGLRRGVLTSGAVWYAQYGWKGAPIFEEVRIGREARVAMGHNGRFADPDRPARYVGVIVNLTETTVFFENPTASARLPDELRVRLHALPNFDITRSVASWTPGQTQASVEWSRRMIEACDSQKRVPQID